MPKQTVCLSMIVKNEVKVIARCLESVKPIIATWVIVDTGSTDGTQDAIRASMAGVPGELHERPWKDFGHNRSEAIELARGKADYDFVIDADDVLEVPKGFRMPELTADSYQIRVEDAGITYFRTHLFRGDLDFRYQGVLHEVLVSGATRSVARLDGLVYRRKVEGARSADPDKFKKDAAVLEAALAAEPGNARYAYYLAQSLRDAGDHRAAAEAYGRRAAMGGWEEEVFSAWYERGKCLARVGAGDDAVLGAYLRAFEARPTRAESLCEAARHLRENGRAAAAYPFARAATAIPHPQDILFVDASVYAWRALDELAVSAYWAGRYREAMEANGRLLSVSALPAGERERVQKNLAFCREKVGPGASAAKRRR